MELALGERIRIARTRCKKSQVELARDVGISKTTLSDIETGNTVAPSSAIITDIARVLNVSADFLLGLRDEPDRGGGLSVSLPTPQQERQTHIIGKGESTANPEHLDILRRGVERWNGWRRENPDIQPDLRGVDLRRVDLSKANLRYTNLAGAKLHRAKFCGADLSEAILRGAIGPNADFSNAHLHQADLRLVHFEKANFCSADLSNTSLDHAVFTGANLSAADLREAFLQRAELQDAICISADLGLAFLREADLQRADLHKARLNSANLNNVKLCEANLREADLTWATLAGADLRKTDLWGADLKCANLVQANLEGANLTRCLVYGISAWDLTLEGATQSDLLINEHTVLGPTISVDNLEIAQFIHLLLHNAKIRHVIDTITSKVVLILGRFTPERKAILDALREELRRRDYVPVLFDFEKPASRDLTETISTLAHMARFVIADITDAKSIPQELQRIVPDLPSVPVQPLLHTAAAEYGMFEHFRRYPWVLEVFQYNSVEDVLNSLQAKVIDPAEAKAKELLSTR
jgi:transcriptional regulator with XRE-family HTH domain